MLVLVTMFISVSNNLPKTSYMKMIDVWLLFNLLYPFIIVLIHTRMDSLRENDEEEETNTHTGNALVVSNWVNKLGQSRANFHQCLGILMKVIKLDFKGIFHWSTNNRGNL